MGLRRRIGAIVGAFSFAAALAGLGACDHVGPADSSFGGSVNHALGGFESCGALEEYAREAAMQLVHARVESACTADTDWEGIDSGGGDTTPVDGDADGDGNGGAEDADEDGDYSTTNNQEQGVDEADLVKTDGEFLYSLHAGELVITGASDDGALEVAGRAEVGGYANEMFLYGDTAVVFSTFDETEVPEELRIPTAYSDEYGYIDCFDSWCWTALTYTQMAIVDVSDRAAPEVLRTVLYGGEYVTARLASGGLRLALFTPIPDLEMVWDYGEDDAWDGYDMTMDDVCEETIDLNEGRFAAVGADAILPKKIDSVDGAVTELLGCGDVLGPATPDGVGVTSIVSLDLDAPLGAPTAIGVFGTRNLVYASPETLYLATSREYVIAASSSGLWEEETSGIHAFDIASAPGSAAYIGTGDVPGRTLSQFSMGEKDGFLRIATTTGDTWDPAALENHVLVLRVSDGALRIVGRLDGLGAGEEIYAARFVGDRGFLVTYYETDPLFTLDMSDPYAPALVGQWVGPGYSTYLHPFGDDLLISVGLEDWVPALSLYDLSDFSNPVLVERVLFDSSFSTSALYEHKAFLLDEERELLAVPYTGYTWDEDGGDYAYDTGLAVYGVTAGGFDDVGWLALSSSSAYEGDVLRAVTIGDSVFGVSRCRIASAAFAAPTDVLDSEPLYTGASCDDVYGYGYGDGDVDWD